MDGKTEVSGSVVPSGRAGLELGLLDLPNCFLRAVFTLLIVPGSPLLAAPLVTQGEV